MSTFEKAYTKLAAHEGTWLNHEADSGGATNFGISLRFLKRLTDTDGDGYLDGDLDRDGDVDIEDVRLIDAEKSKQLYFHQWWARYAYGFIHHQLIADKVLSFSVHMGPGRAHRIVQQAISKFELCSVDGIIGPITRGLINTISPEWLLVEIKHEAAQFYIELILEDPTLQAFENGWFNRAYSA